ncbi:PREDICTED: ubiquitin-conjugating enzyme E2 variant 3 isoform X2 [Miniopterus natalensis]|uniref:ubiquitin-conjugating enzyme E2 variant 3 isoform X2 n=1 Tax=Miniopterus natalensis TaxID=291302 RepID=UPI0007A6E5E5|nr:PREDICTED: ubiquitin-conjugating enzyme E2 variant 3 isoform X2 [Miniopterus natalensis]
MEFDCEGLRRLLGKYKFRDLTVEELKNVNMFFPHFRYSMDTYVFKDSSQKDLLNFTGTVPVKYQGNTYNIPIRLWILDSHPFAPPICFLKPTANMGISVGKHVDAQGRIYLPYLQNWSHPKSVLVGLIKEMIAKFQEELPLYSLSSSDEAQQVDLLAYIAKITEGVSDINSKNWANHENKTVKKITVVGGGELGVACTLAISAKSIADRIVLLDLSEGTTGGMMDLEIFNLPNVEISKDLSASAHSKVVIFTVNSLGSSQSYLDVVQRNVDMFRALVPALGHYSQHSVLLVASQPVEIMTYVTWKLSTFPANRVIGIGCNLDSQRIQYIITNVLKAQTSGKPIWVIGEHGEDKETNDNYSLGEKSHEIQDPLGAVSCFLPQLHLLPFCQAFCASQMVNLQFPEWFMRSLASLPLHLMLLFPEHSFTWLSSAYLSRLGLSATSPRKPSLIIQVK